MKSIFALSHTTSTAVLLLDSRIWIPLRNRLLIISYNKSINVEIAKGLSTGNFVISSDKMNDKRKIDKFSNYILYTQRET